MSTASARRAGRPDPAQYGSAGLQQRARAAAAGSARRRGEFVVAGPGQQPAADSERARSQLRHDAGLARPETSWGRGPEAAREPASATARAHRGSASARGADPAESSWAGDALAPRQSGGDGGRGLLWGARIDDRLDRLERLLEVAAGRHQDVEERLTAMTTRYAEQQNQLEELRFEVRRRPPPEATPPPPQPAAPAPPGRGPDSLVLAGQLQAMQRQCDALGSQVAEIHASTSTAQGLDDKVARAVATESKQIRVELSRVHDALNLTQDQCQQLGRETEGTVGTLKRRMNEWELSSTKTEQTLLAELHELGRTSGEAVKRLSTVESDYQIFLMKMERHEKSAQDMEENFADFVLAKEELDEGIESLAKQQKEFEMDKAKSDAICEHLQEETGSLQATAIAFRGELDGANKGFQEREAAMRALVGETVDAMRAEAKEDAAEQAEARSALEKRLQQHMASIAAETFENAQAEDAANAAALREELSKSSLQLQASVQDTAVRSQQNLAEAREKLGQEMHQLRLDDAVLWKDTEQIARELALKMQHNFQELGRRAEKMAEQLARNTEAMGDELARNTNEALQELAGRLMETEAEAELSKLVLRTAVERNTDWIDELRNSTAERFDVTHAKVEELHQAQADSLSDAVATINRQQDEVQAIGREELASSILDAEENLQQEVEARESSAAEMRTSLTKHIKALGKNTSRKLTDLQADTRARMDQQHRDLVKLIETLHGEVTEEIVAQERDVSQMEQDVEQRFTELQSETAKVLGALRTSAEEAESELRSEINERFEETELAQAHTQMINRLVDQSAARIMAEELRSAIVAAEASSAASLEATSTQIQETVVQLHKQLEQVDLHHCAQGLTIRAVVESELERAATDRLGLHAAISTTNESLQEQASKLEQAFTAGLADMSGRLDAEKTQLSQRLEGSMRALHLLQKLMSRSDSVDIFAEFDTDGDGEISREELQAGFAKMGEQLSETEVDAVMSLVDSDGDGSIDSKEFTQMGKITKEVEAVSGRLLEGIHTVSQRMDAEVSGLNASITSNVAEVSSAVERLRADASAMLEERVVPCEQKVEQLRTDTSTMLEDRVKPCEESIVQLRDDTATMLEQRVKPCEEKVDVLRADTKSMLEERLKPCEAHIRGLRGEQDALQGTLSGNTVQLEQLAARAQDLDQQCQWTNSVLEEESQRREAVEEAVGATWMKVDESLRSVQREMDVAIVEKLEPCLQQIATTQQDLHGMRQELGENLRAEVQSIDGRLAKVVHDVDTTVTAQLQAATTAVLEQESRLGALDDRVISLADTSEWRAEAAADEAEALIARVQALSAQLEI